MIKSIFFDLDQTLLDRTKTFSGYLVSMYQDLNIGDAGVSAQHFFDEVNRWDDNGYRDKRDTFNRVIEQLKLPLTVDQLFHHFDKYYGQDSQLFPGIPAFLEVLHKKYPLVLITNGRTNGQQMKLRVTGIEPFFKEILISEAEGIKKPDPDIYLRACQRVNLSPVEVLFVGDHPHNDVEIPKSLGMKAVWVENDNYKPPKVHDGIVSSVLELPQFF